MGDKIPYSDLNPSEIRLVSLHAGKFDAPLEVTSSNVAFTPTLHQPQQSPAGSSVNPKYEALSYIWGPLDPLGPTLNFRIGDRILHITIRPSLDQALRHLRMEKQDRVFYIDFLSVSQESESERMQQINLFADVFYNASNVCIWLGPSADDSDRAMDLIAQILDFQKFEQLTEFPLTGDHRQSWVAFSKLIGREWFQRRWIVQEMALARNATVHCGSRSCSWGDFSDALALFQSRWLSIYQDIHQADRLNVGEIQPPGATSLVTISANIFRKDQNGNIKERRYDLESLLAILPIFNITVPGDAVWSVAALASDFKDAQNALAKLKSATAGLTSLLAAVVEYIILKSQTLDVICRPWAPDPALEPASQSQAAGGDQSKLFAGGYPSWIGEVSNFPFTRRPDGQYDRNNADSMVGLPGQHCYNAAGGIPIAVATHCRSPIDYQPCLRLSARGLVIDVVKDVGSVSEGTATIPQKWQHLAGWKRRHVDPVPDQFWRTIVADRTANRDNPPSWYARACEHSARLSNTKSINITGLIERCQHSSHLQEFLRRVQAVIWNRNMFVTERSGSLGIGPASVEVGDLICILYGCSVPVVLRRKPPSESPGDLPRVSSGNLYMFDSPYMERSVIDYWKSRDEAEAGYYEFVGESFVYGWMEGQAIERHKTQLSAIAKLNKHTKHLLKAICQGSDQDRGSKSWVSKRKLKIERLVAPGAAGGPEPEMWTFAYANGNLRTESFYKNRHNPEVFVRNDAQDLEDIQTWKFSVIETREEYVGSGGDDDRRSKKETVTELPDNVGFRQAIEYNAERKKELNKLMYMNPPSGQVFFLL